MTSFVVNCVMFGVHLSPCLCTALAQQPGVGWAPCSWANGAVQLLQQRQRVGEKVTEGGWEVDMGLPVVMLWIFKIAFIKKYNCDSYSFEDGS